MSVRPDSASDPRDQPESPWLRRSEWSQRRVSARRAGAVSYSFAILWNTLILLMLGVVFLSPTGNKTAALLGLAPFAVAGLVLLSSAVRSTLRQRRFGQSTFEIETLPGVIGGQLRGAVQVSGLQDPTRRGLRRAAPVRGPRRLRRQEPRDWSRSRLWPSILDPLARRLQRRGAVRRRSRERSGPVRHPLLFA